jgi:lysophospholipase L1-like esterase
VRRKLQLAAALLAVTSVLCFGVAEAAVRVAAAFNSRLGTSLRELDPMAVQIEPHGTHGYRQKPNATFHYENGTVATSNARGYRGPDVPPQPTAGTIRIILLGGSTTHGWGVPDSATIDAHMRSLLRERLPDQRFEVVNLAFDGYDSFQLLERLQSDGLPMQPSIIVLNEGINDVRNATFPRLREEDPRTLIWEAVLERLRAERARGGPTTWTRMKHYSMSLRVPGYVRQTLRVQRELRERRSVPAGEGANDKGPPYPEAAEFFERNMRRMVQLAQERGIPVLLSTPPSALKWMPDTVMSARSYWVINARTTQSYRDELARRLQRIAASEQSVGHAVRYASPQVSREFFLDDCHLSSEGNRVVAQAFIDQIGGLLKQQRQSLIRTGGLN